MGPAGNCASIVYSARFVKFHQISSKDSIFVTTASFRQFFVNNKISRAYFVIHKVLATLGLFLAVTRRTVFQFYICLLKTVPHFLDVKSSNTLESCLHEVCDRQCISCCMRDMPHMIFILRCHEIHARLDVFIISLQDMLYNFCWCFVFFVYSSMSTLCTLNI